MIFVSFPKNVNLTKVFPVVKFSNLFEICLQPWEVVKNAQLWLKGRSQTTFTYSWSFYPPAPLPLIDSIIIQKMSFVTLTFHEYPSPLENLVCG